MKISEILQTIKNNGKVQNQIIQLLKQQLQNKKIPHLQLWNMSPPYRFILKFAKFQVYFLAIAGFTLFPILMFQKYLSSPEKGPILATATVSIMFLMAAPLFYYKRKTNKLFTNIAYDLANQKLLLQKFAGKATIEVPANQINYELTKNQRIKVIQVGNNKYSIEGMGEWKSIQIFKHVQKMGEL